MVKMRYYLDLTNVPNQQDMYLELEPNIGENLKREDVIWFDEENVKNLTILMLTKHTIATYSDSLQSLSDLWLVIKSRHIIASRFGHIDVELICDSFHEGSDIKDEYKHLY